MDGLGDAKVLLRVAEAVNSHHGEPLLVPGTVIEYHGDEPPPGWKDITGGAVITAEEYPEAYDTLYDARERMEAFGLDFEAPGVVRIPDLRGRPS